MEVHKCPLWARHSRGPLHIAPLLISLSPPRGQCQPPGFQRRQARLGQAEPPAQRAGAQRGSPTCGPGAPRTRATLPLLCYPTGSPGSPRGVLVTKSASELTLQWTEGNAGKGPTTGYVIEARPSGKAGGPGTCSDCQAQAGGVSDSPSVRTLGLVRSPQLLGDKGSAAGMRLPAHCPSPSFPNCGHATDLTGIR